MNYLASITKTLGHLVRPLSRHRWVFLACLVATVAYAVLSLRHGSTEAYGHGFLFYDHGWPNEYLEREVAETVWAGRWRLFTGVDEFLWLPLMVNLAVALGLSSLLTYLWSFHRRHHRPWQFSLKELLLTTLVVSLTLGLYFKLRNDYDEEVACLEELESVGFSPRYSSGYIPWYLQPVRDLGLTDDEDWSYRGVEWSYELDPIAQAEDINQQLAAQISEKRHMSFLRSVVIDDPRLTDHSLELLCRWAPNCKDLDIMNCPKVTDEGIASVASRLTELKSLNIEGMAVNDAMIRHIATMEKLESLRLNDLSKASGKEYLKRLLKLPRLQLLAIPQCWSPDDWNQECIVQQIHVGRREITVWYYTEW